MADPKPEPQTGHNPVDERMGYVSPQRYEDISNDAGGSSAGQNQQQEQSGSAPEQK